MQLTPSRLARSFPQASFFRRVTAVYEIRRDSGRVMLSLTCDSLVAVNLQGACLPDACLNRADLTSANLKLIEAQLDRARALAALGRANAQ